VYERYRVYTGRAEEARARAFRFLDAHRRPDSWVGEMSSSALATAISCLALRLQPEAAMLEPSIRSGLDWLAETQQADGGWGDGVIDASNMNATSLTASVLQYCDPGAYSDAIWDALQWVERAGGFRALNDPRAVSLSGPCRSVYALAGFVDWSRVRKLPTEMILLPRRIRRTVSTTFPAFLSLSLMHEHFSPVPPWRRPLRRRAAREALAWLRQAQGPNGSYEESAFLTSLIVVALTVADVGADDIIQQALPFVRSSQRADGSWPIDRDLENFDTAQAVFAHHEANRPIPGSEQVREWFLKNQFRTPFFATSAPPGGWAWARPAGWPDVDDTSYALRALRILGVPPEHGSIRLGVRWLYEMQNRDGSWPTFVRGSKMPFDHDCPYITAHVLSTLATMGPEERQGKPVREALSYLRRHQNRDGSFDSLWFRMHTCGTAAVIEALADLQLEDTPMTHRASEWLRTHQNSDGGWGDGRGASSTAEETAWAAAALLRLGSVRDREAAGRVVPALI
jgi:squalene-hopene/tetraprenyl-beta-curcumene cyclase